MSLRKLYRVLLPRISLNFRKKKKRNLAGLKFFHILHPQVKKKIMLSNIKLITPITDFMMTFAQTNNLYRYNRNNLPKIKETGVLLMKYFQSLYLMKNPQVVKITTIS